MADTAEEGEHVFVKTECFLFAHGLMVVLFVFLQGVGWRGRGKIGDLGDAAEAFQGLDFGEEHGSSSGQVAVFSREGLLQNGALLRAQRRG